MNDSVGKTGFTLIEMIIVLVIVILLGAMSIPAEYSLPKRTFVLLHFIEQTSCQSPPR